MHAEMYKSNTLLGPSTFLILDQQSTEDRKVIVICKDKEWLTPEGEEAQLSSNPQDNIGVITKRVWKKYRFPFEEAWGLQCALDGFSDPYPTEQYFVEVVEEGNVSESESEELETDESTTSEEFSD